MNKPEVESILLANLYLTKCKLDNSSENKIELARKFLTIKINKLLAERKLINQPITVD